MGVCTHSTCTVFQSDPLSLSSYANHSPSSEKELRPRATVPSSDNVLGSKKTRACSSSESCTYSTLDRRKEGGGSGGVWHKVLCAKLPYITMYFVQYTPEAIAVHYPFNGTDLT